VYLNGQGIPDLDARGERVTDESFILCFNAHHESIEFSLPPKEFGESWDPVIDTATNSGTPEANNTVMVDGTVTVSPRSVMVVKAGSPAQA
jgi:glycogen operon protein